MNENTPNTVFLKDYQTPNYLILKVHLTFKLDDTKTNVKSILRIKQNPESSKTQTPIELDGEQLLLKSIKIDGRTLSDKEYDLSDEKLIVPNVPEEFTLEIENEINPQANKALNGLYKSGSIFCTQNEAEGFRRITYFMDRPDIMSKFKTKIIADKIKYPTLLSNGNPIGKGELSDGQHWVEWEDPFPKPCYLYALVAGNLGMIQDEFITMSGRKVDLRIYCDLGNEDKCFHAMESLKKSMKWDEDTFGLEYDLDIYMIVAVSSFNMGAMENKGLNIFNTAYVLANPKTATDQDFLNIEGVIAHEYFHNWTGNRVTCRDWFQLTLKEGLTVFRDQIFSADMNSEIVERISNAKRLRQVQFVEDAGPTAHPIKPKSYIEINNFYTSTVYSKGAEVIGMICTITGRDGFKKGIKKYFELFDGQAVTTEDFIHAMEVANEIDLTQFKNWYSQAGTPEITFDSNYYDEKKKTFTVRISQYCPPTPGQKEKQPFHIPINIGLIGRNGKDISSKILHIKKQNESFTFENITETPTISINRGFSAPVKIIDPHQTNDLIFLMANDNDEFNRFEATEKLAILLMNGLIDDYKKKVELKLDQEYIDAFGKLLDDQSIDYSYKSLCMGIPQEDILFQNQNPVETEATHFVRKFLKKTIALAHKEKLLSLYVKFNLQEKYLLDNESVGKRSLKNSALGFLMLLGDTKIHDLCFSQFENATNMTDEISALSLLAHNNCERKNEALEIFYNKWKNETLVMQKWFAIQAFSPLSGTLENVMALQKNPAYDKNVPNLVRSLIGPFTANAIHFHSQTGEGYKFIADQIIDIDNFNPQMASRLAHSFQLYKRMKSVNKKLMKPQLERILHHKNVSKNVFEIVSKVIRE